MCGAFDQEDEGDHEPEKDRDSYILDPFPNDKFVPYAWMDILAILDVCVNEVTPTIFCDEEGYDLIPFHMVFAIKDHSNQQEIEEESHEVEEDGVNILHNREEISVRDKESSKNLSDSTSDDEAQQGEQYYDASDKLEDFQDVEL